jgi:hypothetical protein
MSTAQIKRLTPDDPELAIAVFSIIASVFREDADALGTDYVTRLLKMIFAHLLLSRTVNQSQLSFYR